MSLLQHDHQGIKEGIFQLDSEKQVLQKSLKHFAEEYKSYVGEMEQFNFDVNSKINGILASMEPTRMEWRIERISQKLDRMEDMPIIR